jgi:hypothetical protein
VWCRMSTVLLPAGQEVPAGCPSDDARGHMATLARWEAGLEPMTAMAAVLRCTGSGSYAGAG